MAFMVRPITKQDMKEEIQEQLTEQTEKLRQLGEKISESAQNLSRATNEYVQENPWKTIAIAAAVGFVAGMLITRGRDED